MPVLLFSWIQLEDEEKVHLMALDEDDDQCIRLLSFCKKHRQPSNERPSADSGLSLRSQLVSSSVHGSNTSGCARTGRDINSIIIQNSKYYLFILASYNYCNNQQR